MFGTLKTLAVAGAVAASALMTTAAHAQGRIVGLVDGKTIVTIDPAIKKVVSTVNISGAGPLLGIDVRPADGMLYGVTSDGNIVTIDVASGKATMKSKLSEPWTRISRRHVRLQPGGRPPAPDELGRRELADQCRRRQGDRRRLAQVQGRDGRQDAARRRGRLHQLVQGHQGDGALQHRSGHQLAGAAGAAE